MYCMMFKYFTFFRQQLPFRAPNHKKTFKFTVYQPTSLGYLLYAAFRDLTMDNAGHQDKDTSATGTCPATAIANPFLGNFEKIT